MKDTFRKVYKKLNEDNSQLITDIKEAAEKLELLLDLVDSREMALAKTNLEQCTMWSTKAVVLQDEKLNGLSIKNKGKYNFNEYTHS